MADAPPPPAESSQAPADRSRVAPPHAPDEPPPPSDNPTAGARPAEGGGGYRENTLDRLLAGSASWLLSLCLHLTAIVALALVSLPSLRELELLDLSASLSPEEPGLDDAPLLDFERAELDASLDPLEPMELASEALVAEAVAEAFTTPPPLSFAPLAESGLTTAIAGQGPAPVGAAAPSGYGRGAAARGEAVRRGGGSDASEAAVARALDWLARHQNPDGSWSLVHNLGRCNGRCGNPGSFVSANPAAASLRAGTGLALLPFLGAGQTHLEGKHKQTVARGLNALVTMGVPNDKGPGASWADPAGRMYSHGIATIVLTEALGITGDSSLAEPAQAALDFIAYAQGPDGGWRYAPKQIGDTSVTGWQVMALKSGYLARLNVPPVVARRAYNFFDTVQHNAGARYAYVSSPAPEAPQHGEPTGTLSAVALLGRMYLGWQRDRAALARGVELLARAGPSEDNVYHNYYAAQVLFQYTGGEGELWRGWNEPLREQLVAQQEMGGHARGSWFVGGPHSARGGRLYQTSLAAMTLEVYYRYLPIYQLDTKPVEFPE